MTYKPGNRIRILNGGGFSETYLTGTYLHADTWFGFHRVLIDGVDPLSSGSVGFPHVRHRDGGAMTPGTRVHVGLSRHGVHLTGTVFAVKDPMYLVILDGNRFREYYNMTTYEITEL